MTDAFNLARFVEAQAGVYDTALAELSRGRKTSHWMWFIFPQLKDLGRSDRGLFYGIASLDEARAYLDHPVLGRRLRACTSAINDVHGRTAFEIFGATDEQKLKSSMTLFARASTEAVFSNALEKYFDGEADPETLAILAR
jgi:uncharacterized protein (DUF1810 family)